ncbi:MAG: beta-lactamase family protein [Eudoraea sp.]|nr:beta-lactamase family protein [Eudoraea sp.]MBT8211297.1 beta-lactamase family protein [Eudoraea sp.]
MDAALHNLAEQQMIPGMGIAIFKKEEISMLQGYGYADLKKKTPVDPAKTLFRAASVSKPIAAAALANLVAEGRIDLDASYYDYVPYYPKKDYDFTIRQLAAHTAGIRAYRGKEYALNRPMSIKDSLKVFQEDPLVFPPGSDYLYNSFDWVMLSLAMEEVTGVSFESYVKHTVLDPLGLKNTMPEAPDISKKNQAVCYSRWGSRFKKATPVDNRYKLAGGGYLTTVEDLIRFGKVILEKKFCPEAMDQFLSPQKVKGKSTYYGLGWQVSEDSKGRPYFGHIGNQVGGYSYFKIFPESGLIIAALVNCSDPGIQEVLDGIGEEFQNP